MKTGVNMTWIFGLLAWFFGSFWLALVIGPRLRQ